MKRYALAMLVLGLFAVQGYCQEDKNPAQPAAEAVTAAPAAATIQPQEISIYGEVKAVNPATNSMTIQYYDYDSDEEKSIEITAGSNTKMENAAAISDVKQGNWADVIYAVTDGKNIAKSIIVEKEEAPAEMPKSEAMPQEAPKQQ